MLGPQTADSSTPTTHVIVVEQVKPAQFDWLSLLPTGIALLAAFVGYLIVERFARAREARTDLRTMSASFREGVDAVVTDANEFFTEPGGSAKAVSLATAIKLKISTLGDMAQAIRDGGIALDTNDELIAFRQAVTGGNFESLARPALLPNDARYVQITAAGHQLKRKADLSFYRRILKSKAFGFR